MACYRLAKRRLLWGQSGELSDEDGSSGRSHDRGHGFAPFDPLREGELALEEALPYGVSHLSAVDLPDGVLLH